MASSGQTVRPEADWWQRELAYEKLGVFERLYQTFVDAGDSASETVVDSVLGTMCFVPCLEFEDIPQPFVDCMPVRVECQKTLKYVHPVHYLFASGNSASYQPATVSRDYLEELVKDRGNYRALLFVNDIHVQWDKAGRPVAFGCDLLVDVGATPIRLNPDGLIIKRSMGDITQRIELTADKSEEDPHCRLRIDLAFRLSGTALVLSSLACGVDAPWVWTTLTCEVRRKSAQIFLEGSTIPSETLYFVNDSVHRYDMLCSSCEDLREFMRAENRLAPPKTDLMSEPIESEAVRYSENGR